MTYALLVAATILLVTVIPLNSLTSTAHQAQTIVTTSNPSAMPPQTQWNKTYGGPNNDVVSSVQQTSDGGYIAIGYTDPLGNLTYDFWLVKTDSAGNQQWNRTYGGNNSDVAYCGQQTSDGGYVMAGRTNSFRDEYDDIWLVKTDSESNEEWNKTYGWADGAEIAYSVQQTSEGGYIMTGLVGGYLWLVKTDSAGNQQWNRTYTENEGAMGYSVQQTSDGGYIVAGNTKFPEVGTYGYWLVKTDWAGNEQWNKTLGGNKGDYTYSVQQTSDDGYIMAGRTGSFGAGLTDFWLVKTDSSGNEQWNRTYGGAAPDMARSVQQTSEGGYIVAGYTESFGAGLIDFWLVKTDSSGNEQWNRTYGGTEGEFATSVRQISDGGYIMAGWTNSFGAGLQDFWLLKTGDGTPPSAVCDLAAGSPTGDSITLALTAPGDDGMLGKASGYGVKYSTTGRITAENWSSATDYQQSWEPAENGTIEIHAVTGLASGTRYWFAVEAYDDVPYYGEISNSPSITTLSDTTPPATITLFLTDSPTSTSVALTWVAPGDDGYTGNASGYVVKYSTTGPIDSGNWNSASIYAQSWVPLRNYTVETHTLTGLTPGTTYWFAVEAYDDVRNYGAVSNSPSATTKASDTIAPATISDLQIVAGTSTSVTITWTAPGDDGMNGNATGYIVRYSTSGCITADNWSSAITYPQAWKPAKNGTTETHVITGLSPGTGYWFAVEAYDEMPNYSEVSNSPSATTALVPDTTAPAVIADLAATTATSTSITLTWTAPGDDGYVGNASGYVVKYSITGPIDSGNWNSASVYAQFWTPVRNGTLETHMVTGLTPGTEYWFAVEAYDDVLSYGGVSNSPNAMTATTTTSTTTTTTTTTTTIATTIDTIAGPGTQLTILLVVLGLAAAAVAIVLLEVALGKRRRPI